VDGRGFRISDPDESVTFSACAYEGKAGWVPLATAWGARSTLSRLTNRVCHLETIRKLRREPIGGNHPPDEFAFRRLSRNDGEMPPEVGLRAGFDIEPQPAFPLALIRPMAGIALIRNYGAYVAVELDRGSLGSGIGASRGQ